jgi:serine/threonine protein kinase
MLPIIGRYELLTEIASGGMASVYAARVKGAEGFEKLVALKRMLPAISSDPEFQKMFLDEGRLAAHIRSSYVVSTFDLDRHHDGSFYLVMDLVIGASVSSILRGSGGALLPIPVVV